MNKLACEHVQANHISNYSLEMLTERLAQFSKVLPQPCNLSIKTKNISEQNIKSGQRSCQAVLWKISTTKHFTFKPRTDNSIELGRVKVWDDLLQMKID